MSFRDFLRSRRAHSAAPAILFASTRASLATRRPRRLLLESLETRTMLTATGMRSITEIGNNGANLGMAGTDLLRKSAAMYADGISTPSLAGNPSARLISNVVNNQAYPTNATQDQTTYDLNSLSDFGYAFGQFMDHDMDLTLDGGGSMPIAVAAGDPIGPNSLPFTRSEFDPATGTSTANPRQQVNRVTSYLDLSQVYGSDQATADALRTFTGGLMKTSAGNELPYYNATYFTAQQLAVMNLAAGGLQNGGGVPVAQLFATGDVRGNENLELTSLQTLFVRNHNQLATQLKKSNPNWTDEQLYQEARELNIAEYQAMVYNEWIPAVLGPHALPAYTGYKPNVDPSISTEFSTVAFRFGHSLLSPEIARHGNDGKSIADVSPDGSAIPLSQDFFDPNLINPAGVVDPLTGHTSSDIDPVLKAVADGVSQAMDVMAINDIRNLLFGDFGAGGEDLMARDVQRGRDDGIGSYNDLRVAFGLKPVTSFAQITSDVSVQQKLSAAYNGDVSKVDPFEGGLAEDHVQGSDVGPLFQAILVDQFTRLRDGDQFFYLNESLNPQERQLFERGNTLTATIENNTHITNMQPNAFLFTASISGTIGGLGSGPRGGRCGDGPRGIDLGNFGLRLSGLTVQLQDTSGNVIATTTTDARGNYRFNQFGDTRSAPTTGSLGISGTGDYKVFVSLNVLGKAVTLTSKTISITRGGQQISDVNLIVGEPSGAGGLCDGGGPYDGGKSCDGGGLLGSRDYGGTGLGWFNRSFHRAPFGRT